MSAQGLKNKNEEKGTEPQKPVGPVRHTSTHRHWGPRRRAKKRQKGYFRK